MNKNERSKIPTLCVLPKPTSSIDKNEENTTTEAEFQELCHMQ